MKPLVVFGVGATASLAHYFLTHDSPHEIAAFTVDRGHTAANELFGLPVVPFDEVSSKYPSRGYSMFVAVGYGRVNKFREEKYYQARELGYELVSYVSSKASVWPDAVIGDNCFIMDNNVIQPFATIGNNVLMWSGSHVGHNSVIQDHCFVASHVVISGNVTIEPNCFFGVNATIRDGIRIARESVIGAGALIMKDTAPKQVYVGPTAQLLGISSDRLPSL